jgi:hypothetical protein
MRRMEGLLALHLSKTKPQATHATLSGSGNASMSMAPFGHQLAPLSLQSGGGGAAGAAGGGVGGYQSGSMPSPHHYGPPTGGPPLVHSATWSSLPQQPQQGAGYPTYASTTNRKSHMASCDLYLPLFPSLNDQLTRIDGFNREFITTRWRCI